VEEEGQALEKQLTVERLQRFGVEVAAERESKRRRLQEQQDAAARRAAEEAAAAARAEVKEQRARQKAEAAAARQTEKDTMADLGTSCGAPMSGAAAVSIVAGRDPLAPGEMLDPRAPG
jgi:biotin carboxyl carrier protein